MTDLEKEFEPMSEIERKLYVMWDDMLRTSPLFMGTAKVDRELVIQAMHRAYQMGLDADKWVRVEDGLPDHGILVNGYSHLWEDEDYNPKGIRQCFIDDLSGWTSPVWNNEADCFDTLTSPPTHYQPLPKPPKDN